LGKPHPSTRARMTDVLVDIVRTYRALKAAHGREVELELRLGNSDGCDQFLPGVPKHVFEQLEEDMTADPSLVTRRDTWSETIDYHYVGTSGQPMRTRVSVDSEQMRMSNEHITKRLVHKALVKRVDGCDEGVARICLSHEIPVTDPPRSCVPTHIRIKQKKVFYDVRGEMGVIWAYELSRTWSANSRAAVEHRQHVSEPMYEVECELVDEKGAYTASISDEEMQQSLMLKLRCVLGTDATTPLGCVSEYARVENHDARRGKRVGSRSRQNG